MKEVYKYEGEDKIKSLKTFKQCSLCEKYHRVGEEVDIYDCCDYEDKDWMVNWAKRLQEKDKEPYVSNFVKWVKTVSIMVILFAGCEDLNLSENPTNDIFLELSTSLELIQEGVYAFAYPTNSPHSYIRINVLSNPLNRVFFNSPDSFTISHMGRDVIAPIINYSVYVRDDSTSRQFVYIYQPHIGKTLSVYAIAEDRDGNQISDSLFVQID